MCFQDLYIFPLPLSPQNNCSFVFGQRMWLTLVIVVDFIWYYWIYLVEIFLMILVMSWLEFWCANKVSLFCFFFSIISPYCNFLLVFRRRMCRTPIIICDIFWCCWICFFLMISAVLESKFRCALVSFFSFFFLLSLLVIIYTVHLTIFLTYRISHQQL
jgi:hypothetical protein